MRKRGVGATILLASLVAGSTLVAMSTQPAAPQDGDSRVALPLAPAERAYVLGQMRLFVESIHAVADDLADGRRAQAAEAAAARGIKRNADDPEFPPTLGAKLPAEWKQLGRAMRGGFDLLAQEIAGGEGPQRTLGRLGDITKNCVACHASYRITAAHD